MQTKTLKPEREFEQFEIWYEEILRYTYTLSDSESIWLGGLAKDYYFETLTGNFAAANFKFQEAKRSWKTEFPVPSDTMRNWLVTDFRRQLDADILAFIEQRDTRRPATS